MKQQSTKRQSTKRQRKKRQLTSGLSSVSHLLLGLMLLNTAGCQPLALKGSYVEIGNAKIVLANQMAAYGQEMDQAAREASTRRDDLNIRNNFITTAVIIETKS